MKRAGGGRRAPSPAGKPGRRRGRLIGAHAILYSRDAEADRAFLRDVLGLPGVDAGEGWLIFGLPPAEVAVHPGRKNDEHEFFLMCDDVRAFVAAMQRRGIRCEPVRSAPWGRLTRVTLPGGGGLGVYEPRHLRPEPMPVAKPRRARRGRRKPAPPAGGA